MKYFLIGILWLVSMAASANCAPRTELETVYCQLRDKGESLLKMSEFRRNNKATQRLLLKRAAKKHGLKLPQQVVVNKLHEHTPSAVSKPKALKRAKASSHSFLLESCELQPSQILCPNRKYVLLGNRQNRTLSADVFSDGNALGLERYSGRLDQKRQLNNYLAGSYQRYVEGMLRIGLAASTMTYRKFYYTFADANEQGLDFSARFEKVYTFLKRDKQSMAVKKHYSDETPTHLSQCSILSERLVVCDNQKINWVYRNTLSLSN